MPKVQVSPRGQLGISGRAKCHLPRQGSHITAISFPEKYLKAMYDKRSPRLEGIIDYICRISVFLPEYCIDLSDGRESRHRNGGQNKYCKEALENQLMNVSTTRGYDGVVEQLAKIALVFYQRIDLITVDVNKLVGCNDSKAVCNIPRNPPSLGNLSTFQPSRVCGFFQQPGISFSVLLASTAKTSRSWHRGERHRRQRQRHQEVLEGSESIV